MRGHAVKGVLWYDRSRSLGIPLATGEFTRLTIKQEDTMDSVLATARLLSVPQQQTPHVALRGELMR